MVFLLSGNTVLAQDNLVLEFDYSEEEADKENLEFQEESEDILFFDENDNTEDGEITASEEVSETESVDETNEESSEGLSIEINENIESDEVENSDFDYESEETEIESSLEIEEISEVELLEIAPVVEDEFYSLNELFTQEYYGHIDASDKLFSNRNGNYTTSFIVYDDEDKKLVAGRDYDKTVIYSYVEDTVLYDGTFRFEGDEVDSSDIVPPGTIMKITATGIGNYSEKLFTGQYMMIQYDISKASFRVYTQYYNNDEEIRPGKDQIELKLSGKILGADDYDITGYENNVKKGTGRIYIQGKDIYGGEKVLTFSIVMPPTRISILFNGNGSNSGSMANQILDPNKTIKLTKNRFVRKGYFFDGWNTETDGSGDAYADEQEISNEDYENLQNLFLYAQWIPEEYQINYILNGGINNALNTKTQYNADDDTFQIVAPLKEDWPLGYQFGGWFTENTYKNRVTEVRKGTIGDISLYALWIPYNYTVSFDGNGATSGTMADQAFSYGIAQTISACKYAKKGSVFMGWAISQEAADNLEVSYELKDTVTDIVEKRSDENGRITLYAVWKDTFNISYNTNGGSFAEGVSLEDYYTYGTAKNLLTPAKRGYSFGGWFTDDGTFKKQVRNITRTTTGDIVIYAKWNKYNINVSFNGNGQTSGSMAVLRMTMDADYSLNVNKYSKKGYEFLGWSFEKQALNSDDFHIDYYDNDSIDAIDVADKYWAYLENLAVSQGKPAPSDPLLKNNQTIMLYAVWTQAPYHIYYDACGGTVIGGDTDTYFFGNPDGVQLKEAVRSISMGDAVGYYEFLGWYTDASYRTKLTKITASTFGDLHLYAKWSLKYDISFDANPGIGNTIKGTMTEQKNVKYDVATAIKRNTFSLADENSNPYIFLGWSLGPERALKYQNGEKIFLPDDGIEYDSENERFVLKLYAVWGQSFTINYECDGGNIEEELEEYSRYNCYTAKALPKNVVKEGYDFGGWYLDEALKQKIVSIAKGSYGNKTLYAKWNPKSYTVSFASDGPEGRVVTGRMNKQSFKYSVAKALPNNAYKISGFTFIGWNTSKYQERSAEEKETVLFNPGQVITLRDEGLFDTVLYPVFRKDTYAIVYNNVAGITNSNPDSYTVDDTVVLSDPQKLGDTFLGWYKDAGYRTKISEIKKGSTGAVTLYAKWSTTRFTLCYNLNAGNDNTAILDTSQVGYVNTYDQKYSGGYRLATATREGYQFGGWYKDARGSGAVGTYIANPFVNMTVYAKWIPYTYNVHFDKNNELATGTMRDMASLKYGTEYKLTANAFRKNNYTFTGWNTQSDGSGTSFDNIGKIKNLTSQQGETINLYAKWTPCSYGITYYLNGGTLPEDAPNSYYYGDEFNFAEPVWVNHKFLGWYKDSRLTEELKITGITSEMSGNIKIYAKWKYDVRPDVDVPEDYLDVTNYGAIADDGEEDLEAFKAAIRKANENVSTGGITTIYVPAGTYNVTPSYKYDSLISFQGGGNITLIMDNEAIIHVTGNEFDEFSVVSFKNTDNVTVIGGVIEGDRYRHFGNSGEWGHGVGIYGSRDITVYGMEVKANWGDGVYLGTQQVRQSDGSQKNFGCENITISHCELHDNRRSNISLTDADNVVIDNCNIYDAHGTAPQCGIYVEPNSDSSDRVCEHVTISNTKITAYQNKNDPEYMVFMTHYNPYDLSYVTANDILFDNCELIGFFGNYSGTNLRMTGTTIKGTVVNLKKSIN